MHASSGSSTRIEEGPKLVLGVLTRGTKDFVRNCVPVSKPVDVVYVPDLDARRCQAGHSFQFESVGVVLV